MMDEKPEYSNFTTSFALRG